MDSKDIKSNLKEARTALGKKDYDSALKHCEAVLQADPKNYNAYVFKGVAYQELHDSSRAVTAFKQAIAIAPTQKLAWQGLAAFYEKGNQERHKHSLLDIYPKLIELSVDANENEKLFELYGKFSQLLLDTGDPEKCVEMLKCQLEICTTSIMESQVHAAILQACATLPTLSSELQTIFDSSLQEYFKSQHTLLELKKTFLLMYVIFLCKKQQYDQAVEEIDNIHKHFSDNTDSLELVGQCHLEIAYRDGYKLRFPDCENVLQKLKDEKPDSHVVEMLSLLTFYYAEHMDGIIKLMRNELNAVNPFECELCAKCCLLIHQYTKAIKYSLKGLRLCGNKNFNDPCMPSLQQSLKLSQLSANFYCKLKADALNDISCLEKLITETTDEKTVSILMFRNYVKIEDVEHARMVLQKYEHLFSVTERLGFDGTIFKLERKWAESKVYLSEAVTQLPTDIYLLLELALVCREQHDLNASISYLVQALKQDPYNPSLYFEMGRHFLLLQSFLKAVSCFQKAYNLFPESEEIGIALSDLYQQLNHEEDNINLLTAVTSSSEGIGAKWAWLKLGLHHLKHGSVKLAIRALHSALRIDPNDSHCWESLADAYVNQGSYTSALKSYSKALELNPDSVYCSFQLASIKQLLQDYAESAVEYHNLLDKYPDYVPALKGYGEVLFLQAKSNLSQYFHGLARDFCEKAISVLTKAVFLQPNLVCLWKLLGDVCALTLQFPSAVCLINVPCELMKLVVMEKNVSQLAKLDLLLLGSRCYGRAVKLMPKCAALWHDLGVSYYLISVTLNNEENEEIEKSFMSLQKAVRLDAKNTLHWNSLGVVAAEMKNYPLSQHCFIKSIENDRLNAIAWTNLGALYLMHDMNNKSVLELANQIFSIAQSVDPSYLNSWIGQGTIAELVDHADAMDLFRHATNMGNHDESAMGYASWVISTLLLNENHEDEHYKYWVENMAAIPIACDCMTRYTDRNRADAQGLNMYGVLLEKEGLNASAVKAFSRSLELLEEHQDAEKDIVRCNYARVLCATGNYGDSCKEFLNIKTPNLASQCGLALACCKAQLWDKSIEAFEAAYDWFARTENEKSQLLVAIAMVYFQQNDIEMSKTFLLQSSQLETPSVHGILALCALGILHYETESELAVAALEEVEALACQKDFLHSALVTMLKSALLCAQNKLKLATGAICKAIHEQPTNHTLWSLLSHHLTYFKVKTHAIIKCALTSEKTYNDVTAKALLNANEITGEILLAISLAMTSDIVESIRRAQKAIHLNPNGVMEWCSLLIPIIANINFSLEKLGTGWIQLLLSFTELKIQSSAALVNKTDVLTWLLKNKTLLLIQLEDWNSAQLNVQQLQIMPNMHDSAKHLLKSLLQYIMQHDSASSREVMLQL